MAHKMGRVRVEEYAYYVNKLGQDERYAKSGEKVSGRKR